MKESLSLYRVMRITCHIDYGDTIGVVCAVVDAADAIKALQEHCPAAAREGCFEIRYLGEVHKTSDCMPGEIILEERKSE